MKKKRTFKGMLFSAALLTSVGEVQAQDNPITFTRDMTFREEYGWANSNATPRLVISTMMESTTCGWMAVGNRKDGRPGPFLRKDWAEENFLLIMNR